MRTPEMVIQEWRDIDWPEMEKDVHGLQRRIYRASQKEDIELVHRLQRLLMSSRSSKLLAVRRVTQDNQGKKTAGIDGIACLEPEERLLLIEQMDLDAEPKPTRRVWIPKPGTDELRPLGIPTIHDRATQALVKLALEPAWEARFEPNSYGFRPGRSCHDAIVAIFNAIQRKPKWVLDADIAKCFDRINHEALLKKVNAYPAMQRMIKAWLEAGYLDGDTLFPTNEGTPQGGVISPLLANIALHGLEEVVRTQFSRRHCLGEKKKETNWQPITIRYADDFLSLHRDEGVVRECQAIAQDWLKDMGLELKPSKTRIAHTLNEVDGTVGFDFLGFTIRQHRIGKYHSGKESGRLAQGAERKDLGFKTIIKPSKEKVKIHYDKLKAVIACKKCVKQTDLIKTLNPIIRGWSNYYRIACSKRIFSKLDNLLYAALLPWAKRRHPKKNRDWIVKRYWQLPKWIFGAPGGMDLRCHAETKIVRHVKITGNKSPYDGDWTYWAARQAHYPGISPWMAMVLKRQHGKCVHCGMLFMPTDLIEIHHQLDVEGKRTGKLDALHRHCHDVVHGPKSAVKPDGECQ